MAVKKITTVFQFRRDSYENWLLNKDCIPAAGEPCFILDKNILKIGDGSTTFENLEPINGVKFEIAADGKSIVLEDNVLKLMGFDTAEVGAQPRKNADGNIEWVVPSTETVDGLKTTVAELQTNVSALETSVTVLKDIVMPAEEGEGTLLDRVEGLEHKMDGTGEGTVDAKIDAKIKAFAESVSADGKVNTLLELINYVESHGAEAADMAKDIKTLQDLVGTTPVDEQILAIVNASGHMDEKKANAVFEHVKYEITGTPAGTLVDYRDKEIRVMVPAGAQFVKQTVGGTGNANMYYMGFKAYAPDGAVSFKEGDRGVIVDEMFDFNGDFAGTDEFGRNYSICWLALATYDAASDSWTYFGKNSSAKKYIGWDYCVEWYDANGVVIASDKIRINLSNEACHSNIEPYYMTSYVKEVAVNGTLLEMVDGRIDIAMPKVKGSDEIDVAEDGTLSIKVISFDKIVQNPDDYIVMDGGSAV